MYRICTTTLASLACIISTASSPFAQDENRLILRRGHAECIRDNATEYLKQKDDPVFIYSGFCMQGDFAPHPDIVTQKTSKNSFAFVTIKLKENVQVPENELASLVILTAAQITCIRDHFSKVARSFDQVESDSGTEEFVELSLDVCGK